MNYLRMVCAECRGTTMHAQIADTAPTYCLRHQGQVLKAYFSQKETMNEAIMAARQSVEDFPAYAAYRSRN